MVRIASYNVESLFARVLAFDGAQWVDDEPVLDAYREVNTLFQKPLYTDAEKTRIIELLLLLDFYRTNSNSAIRLSMLIFWALSKKKTASPCCVLTRNSWVACTSTLC